MNAMQRLEHAASDNRPLNLSVKEVKELLTYQNSLVEAKNELVRENFSLRKDKAMQDGQVPQPDGR